MDRTEAYVNLISFLVWAAEENEMFGAVKAQDALLSLSFLLNIKLEDMRKIAMPGH